MVMGPYLAAATKPVTVKTTTDKKDETGPLTPTNQKFALSTNHGRAAIVEKRRRVLRKEFLGESSTLQKRKTLPPALAGIEAPITENVRTAAPHIHLAIFSSLV